MSFRKMFKRNNSSNNESTNKGLKKLLEKEGFYIIMFLCVCIVGVVAVWVVRSNVDRIAEERAPQNDEMNIADSEIIDIAEKEIEDQTNDIIIIDQQNESDELETSQNGKLAEGVMEEKDDSSQNREKQNGKILVEDKPLELEVATSNVNETPVISEIEPIAMIWPAQGELGMGYAVETLAYSKTLEHFTTHHGIDILAEMNTPVKAALAGEVIEVLTDSRLGITITIDHGDGLLTRYSNLCTDLIVNLGDKVTQGQTISGVGTSSIFESAEGPHLHFEVLLNGESVDPLEYLAEE